MRIGLFRHLVSQIPVLQALARSALQGLRPSGGEMPTLPSPWLEACLPPRPQALIDDAIRWAGGEPASWRGLLPPYLFPQWSFPWVSEILCSLPFPLTRILNLGCSLSSYHPLEAGRPLHLRVRLVSAETGATSLRLTVAVETRTEAQERALEASLHAFVPLIAKSSSLDPKRVKEKTAKPPPPPIPGAVREIGYKKLPANAGLEFAALTGDFNPIHWLPPYARWFGFQGCLLHGFGSLALLWEALLRGVFSGRQGALETLDLRFLRPLFLPAAVGIYLGPKEGEFAPVYLGHSPGGLAFVEGRFKGGLNV